MKSKEISQQFECILLNSIICLRFVNNSWLQSSTNISSSSRDNETESWKKLYEAIDAGNFFDFSNSTSTDVLHYFKFKFINPGNEDEFQRLLVNGANFSATDGEGNTAIILAAEKGMYYWLVTFVINYTEFQSKTKNIYLNCHRFGTNDKAADWKGRWCQCHKHVWKYSTVIGYQQG